jgi:Bardet-Biedl syndrome 2 protein
MVRSYHVIISIDVENNKDVFDKEVSDGVSCLAFGTIQEIGSEPLVVAGGNCSITGFDLQGDERFWTVTGDNANTLQFMDWDDDGQEELLVGSDDFSIRVFKGEELIHDINEQSKIQYIKKINKQIFAYSL